MPAVVAVVVGLSDAIVTSLPPRYALYSSRIDSIALRRRASKAISASSAGLSVSSCGQPGSGAADFVDQAFARLVLGQQILIGPVGDR